MSFLRGTTATMGEESESDEEEETFEVAPDTTATQDTVDDGGDTEATSDVTVEENEMDVTSTGSERSDMPMAPMVQKPTPKNITWRHKTLQERNRNVRKQYLSRVCSLPKGISQKLKELGPQLSRHQQVAQDASDSLQVLRDDMSNLQLKLATMLENTEFIPSLHIPCLLLRNIKIEDIESRLTRFKSLPEGVKELHWGPEARIRFVINKFAVNSEVQFTFKPSVDDDGSTPNSIDVFESFRDVAMLHKPFFDKTYAAMLGLLQQLPEVVPTIISHNIVVKPATADEIEAC